MKRCEAPRLVIDPGVPPRLDIGPVTIVVRRPVRDLNARVPYMAVFRSIAPVSIVVQIFISDYVLRNILSGSRMFPSPVTVGAPRFKFVVIRAQILHVRAQLVGSREHRVVVGANGIGHSAAGYLPLSVADLDGSGIAALINVDAIDAGARN